MDYLLDTEVGKHDYDWLLTPPGTPVFPSSNARKNQLTSTTIKNRSTVRPASTAQVSSLLASQSENGRCDRLIRSSSVTRPSISNTHLNSFLFKNRTSDLNTSTASGTYRTSIPFRSSTPGNRSCSVSSRSSAVSHSEQTRSINSAKTRPSLASFRDKTRPSQHSRPNTPTSRPQFPSNSCTSLNSPVVRSTSRPTPTCRSTTLGLSSSLEATAGRSPSASRLQISHHSSPSLNPSSQGPRPLVPVRHIDLPAFSLDAHPKPRTLLPERLASTGPTRPRMALTARASSNIEARAPAVSNRRNSLPIVALSKFPENSTRALSNNSDHHHVLLEIQKQMAPELVFRKASKTSKPESAGFRRTISKMSLDMALMKMNIRQSMGGIKAATPFPHSIRSSAPKTHAARGSEPTVPVINDEHLSEFRSCSKTLSQDSNGAITENRDTAAKPMNKDCIVVKESDFDLYGSSRYDAMFLKEDLKSTNWLYSNEDMSDQSPVFDYRFKPLLEPFSHSD